VLAREAISRNTEQDLPIVFDPACGVGDLLLVVAEYLPICPTLSATLTLWGRHLTGCDIRAEFVQAAKARLILRALAEGVAIDGDLALIHKQAFPLITAGDGLAEFRRFRTATWIVMNPPFGLRTAPQNCSWATGKITTAAHFLETAVYNSKHGTRITAILPDVIRSGSRYARLQYAIGPWLKVNRRQGLGLFATADVHVYVADFTVRAQPKQIRKRRQALAGTIGNTFDVHVGPVVPFRHAEAGPEYPYVHAKGLPRWRRVRSIKERRKFSGTAFKPPFVVVRRTSRPEDLYRATATLITTPTQVAVENHLIVCSPKDHKLKTCLRLFSELKTKRTNDWLNRRIRCRHLTVEALRELPFK
jgi:hypothetical protein